MEESEKRRARLNAMRMEAAQSSGAEADVASSGQSLSNPLVESETTALQHVRPRFDYYTDPMAAFSANRRMGWSTTHQAPQQYHHTPPPPPPTYRPPGQQSFQSPGASYQHHPIETHIRSPLQSPHGNPPRAWDRHNPGPGYGQRGPPNFNTGQGRLPSFNPWQGRGQYVPGRGGHHYPGLGGERGGRRGGGSRDASAEERPDLYYRRVMIEDPWKDLTPVIWKQRCSSDKKSWLPKSIALKKARVSEASPSQPSLAEYLAASFSGTGNDDDDDDDEDEPITVPV